MITKQQLRDAIMARDVAMQNERKWWSEDSQAYLPFDHADFKGLCRIRPPMNNITITWNTPDDAAKRANTNNEKE